MIKTNIKYSRLFFIPTEWQIHFNSSKNRLNFFVKLFDDVPYISDPTQNNISRILKGVRFTPISAELHEELKRISSFVPHYDILNKLYSNIDSINWGLIMDLWSNPSSLPLNKEIQDEVVRIYVGDILPIG